MVLKSQPLYPAIRHVSDYREHAPLCRTRRFREQSEAETEEDAEVPGHRPGPADEPGALT